MATLPALAATDGVIEEMTYALDTLKLDGVATTTSTDDVYLGDARYDPWLEEMNRRDVTLFAQPVPAKASRSVDLGVDVSLLEFMFDTKAPILGIAVVLLSIHLPVVVTSCFELIGSATSGVAVFAVGLVLAAHPVRFSPTV